MTSWPVERYYFDVLDGPDAQRDEVGQEFTAGAIAFAAASSAIVDILRDEVKGPASRAIAMQVRDAFDVVILRVDLTLVVRLSGS